MSAAHPMLPGRAALPTAALPGALQVLLGCAAVLLVLGLVFVASASMPYAQMHGGDPYHYLVRQTIYAALGLGIAAIVAATPVRVWERQALALLAGALLLLLAVLVPGLGVEVNGARRWLDLGVVRLQASEPARLLLVLYVAGFLFRRQATLLSRAGTLAPLLAVLALAAVLLLAEPDFGAVVVLAGTLLAMCFMAGVPLFAFLGLLTALGGAFWLLVALSPYRLQRLLAFQDPWTDPFGDSYQLVQSLIAIGSGGWLGRGLGEGVQKMSYLPEAHTDFIFAILAEELGLLGVVLVLALFSALIWAGLAIADAAARRQQWFGAYLASGLTAWLALQVTINLGVNMGLLPTKGLTLPLLSYGGSSLLVVCAMLGLLWRVGWEASRAPAESQA